ISWIHPGRSDRRRRLLAGGAVPVIPVWGHPYGKPGRSLGGRAGRGPDWIVAGLDRAPDGYLVAGHRLPPGVRLGRNLPLFRARQRHPDARAPAQFTFPWAALAHGRLGGTGGQRADIRAHRFAVCGVRPSAPAGEISACGAASRACTPKQRKLEVPATLSTTL